MMAFPFAPQFEVLDRELHEAAKRALLDVMRLGDNATRLDAAKFAFTMSVCLKYADMSYPQGSPLLPDADENRKPDC